MKTLKIKYDETVGNQGWCALVSDERGWQPIPYCTDRDNIPSIEEACLADPITQLNPADYDSVDVC